MKLIALALVGLVAVSAPVSAAEQGAPPVNSKGFMGFGNSDAVSVGDAKRQAKCKAILGRLDSMKGQAPTNESLLLMQAYTYGCDPGPLLDLLGLPR